MEVLYYPSMPVILLQTQFVITMPCAPPLLAPVVEHDGLRHGEAAPCDAGHAHLHRLERGPLL